MQNDHISCDENIVGLGLKWIIFNFIIDEAGRGCCFSRVYTGAVILSSDFRIPKDIVIKDSKKMTPLQRAKSAKYIKQHSLEWHVGWRDETVVDEVNVTQAAMQAFHENLDNFETLFSLIIMDGTYFLPYERSGNVVQHLCVPQADSKCLAVSCASILAKNARDEYVSDLCRYYPELNTRYDIESNMGYPSPKHKKGIKLYGITQFHRKSYKTCMGAALNSVCSVIIDD